MTKRLGILLFCILLAFISNAQDFNVPFSLTGASYHSALNRLRDSSFVSLTSVDYLSKITNDYDSSEWLMARYNAKGDILYYTKLVLPPDFILAPNDLTVSKDKIFIGGSVTQVNTDESSAFLMRLNECFEVEKYAILGYQGTDYAYFNKLYQFNDSSILALGPYFIESDTLFLTIFAMNHDLKIFWETTIMGEMSDVAMTDYNIHLWGHGYYPLESDKTTAEHKLNHIIIGLNGDVQSQFVQDEHLDYSYSGGWMITKPINANFLIANESLKPSGKIFNGLRKMGMDGTLIKSVQLNDVKKEEGCGGLCRINDNRYLALGGEQLDFFNIIYTAYLVDSNLNVVRKKRLLPDIKLVELCTGRSPIAFNDGALLYGRVYNSVPGTVSNALLYKIDTFLNVMQKPFMGGYTDSLCLAPVSGQICVLPTPDTVWLENLNLRKNIKLGVEKPVSRQNQFKVFPNPSKGNFKIQFSNPESGNILIYNTIGQLILRKEFNSEEQLDFHILDHSSSFYYIQINTESYSMTRKLIIVQ